LLPGWRRHCVGFAAVWRGVGGSCEALDDVIVAGVIVPERLSAAGVVADGELHLTADVERIRQIQCEREPVRLPLTGVYEIRRHLHPNIGD